MLEDKLKATDWEAAEEDIAEMVARESYLQWVKENQKTVREVILRDLCSIQIIRRVILQC